MKWIKALLMYWYRCGPVRIPDFCGLISTNYPADIGSTSQVSTYKADFKGIVSPDEIDLKVVSFD